MRDVAHWQPINHPKLFLSEDTLAVNAIMRTIHYSRQPLCIIFSFWCVSAWERYRECYPDLATGRAHPKEPFRLERLRPRGWDSSIDCIDVVRPHPFTL